MNKKALILILLFFSYSCTSIAFAQNEDIDITQISEQFIETELKSTDKNNNTIVNQMSEEEANEQAALYYNHAIDLYKADEVEKSIKEFNRAIELNPDFYEAHYNLSQILMSINKNNEALKSLEAIDKLQPGNTENIYNLGRVYYSQGLLSKSHQYLKKISVSAPQYDSAKLLISKIEKRQSELNLEEKLKEHKNIITTQGKAKGVDLYKFNAPSGISLDSNGNIFIASFVENRIYKISALGQKTTFSKSSLIQGPIGMAIDNNDNIYLANYSANNIIKITKEGIASIYADVNKPYCLTYDTKHNRLYVTEQETNKLIKYDL